MIDYQATNIINAALNLDLRSKNGLEKFTQIVQTALNEAAQQSVQRIGGESAADEIVHKMADSLVEFVHGKPANR